MKDIWATLNQLFTVLPGGAKRYYIRYSVITSLLSILDVLALGLITAIITPLATGTQAQLPVIGPISDEEVLWLIVVVCALFISKSGLALLLHWRATRRFATYELEVGNRLFKSYTQSSWEARSSLSTAEITRIVDSSMANTNLGFILPLSQLPNNAFTFVAMLVVLVVVQPLTALIALVYLGLVALLMVLVVTAKARQAGRVNRQYAYKAASVMTEMVDAIKEVTLRNKLDEAGVVVSSYRKVATNARANMSFLGIVPRYSLEAALIGGFLLIGGAGFLIGGIGAATVSVSLFAATGFRMIPALNNVQASFTNASANIVYARDVIRELTRAQNDTHVAVSERTEKPFPEAATALELRDVVYRYPGSQEDVLKGVSVTVPFGKSLGVVGPSGAGKSTLIDLILGLSTPTSGSISVDGTPVDEVVKQWRSRVGYVPQRVSLFNGSIAQNVALTWTDDFDEDRVIDALRRAQLSELVEERGIFEPIGERGASISGGQQQRLGIARALYSDPLVLVFDEATSALDNRTESLITKAMNELSGSVTFVTIAHRLSTVRNYDTLCYLDRGRVLGQGSFDELAAAVPDFAHQAQLAGLHEGKETQ
ncbi:ABC transporter ATP-binding protein [Salinibacterium sp. NK8237]|uniref:ABC transporter ATP-binding protein n=1 Tax=Salinibacterium sp. NK8237 TaxID=2792038 RepID=UPI0018CD4E47|nr:ABC transporter ATP-binding protein [Salinibacterium sp. NK8237]MBH0129640.1 ABC transporter ATP-binding protein [Salinibacterium sp. NK8237]